MGVLHGHHHLVFYSHTLVSGLEEKIKTKKKLPTLDTDIPSWTQQINWLLLKLEAVQKEKVKSVTPDPELDEAANTSLECFQADTQ